MVTSVLTRVDIAVLLHAQAKKGINSGDQIPLSPSAEERAAAIAALKARQQQKRRASQAADADAGASIAGTADLGSAASEDGSRPMQEHSVTAVATERCEHRFDAVCR